MTPTKNEFKTGYATVSIIIILAIALIITTSATIVVLTNSLAGSKFEQGISAYDKAESGLEYGIIQLLRNPNYPGGTSPQGAQIGVTSPSANNYIITSKGVLGNFTRTVVSQMDYSNNLTITKWQEN